MKLLSKFWQFALALKGALTSSLREEQPRDQRGQGREEFVQNALALRRVVEFERWISVEGDLHRRVYFAIRGERERGITFGAIARRLNVRKLDVEEVFRSFIEWHITLQYDVMFSQQGELVRWIGPTADYVS